MRFEFGEHLRVVVDDYVIMWTLLAATCALGIACWTGYGCYLIYAKSCA